MLLRGSVERVRVVGWASLALLALSCMQPDAAQAWELRIGTRTSIQCDPQQGVRVEGTRVLVDCYLRDNLNQGIGSRNIVITFQKTRDARGFDTVEVQTDRTGRFYATLQLSDTGTYEGSIRYNGLESYHSPSEHLVEAVKVQRGQVELDLSLPGLVLASEGTLQGRVVATSGSKPVPRLSLEVGVNGTWAALSTGPQGSAAFSLPMPGGGQPSVQIQTRFLGDLRFGEATAQRALRVLRQPSLSLEARNVRARLQRGVELRGALRDEFGGVGQVGVEVLLSQGGVEVGRFRALTDEDGVYALFVPESKLEEGQLVTQARIEVGRQTIDAPEVIVRVEKTGAGILPWLLAGVLALLALGYLGMGLWELWRQRQRRQPGPARQQARAALQKARHPRILPQVEAEVEEEPAQRRQDAIQGILWDKQTESPVVGGAVELSGVGERLSDGRGRFLFEELAAGEYTLQVRALGYVGASYSFSIPHGGELSLFRFPLTPVRVVVRDLFEGFSREVTREGEIWGRLTPRQLQSVLLEALRPELEPQGQEALEQEGHQAFLESLRRAVGEQDDQEMGALRVVAAITHVIEEVYYSQRLHEEEIIDLMDRLVDRARRRVAGGGL